MSEAEREQKHQQLMDQLTHLAPGGKSVSAQVFLHDSVPADALGQVVTRIVDDARSRSETATADLGKVHRYAKSFSVTADPTTLGAILAAPEVKSIIPNQVGDIFPQPINRRQI